MEVTTRVQEAAKLRAEFRRNGKLRLEYLAAMSRLLREYGIGIDDESLANMVPADIAELYAEGPPGGPRPAPSSLPGGPRPAPQSLPGGPRPAPSSLPGGPRPAPQSLLGGPRPAPSIRP
ncbi:MAG: hypothetical protein HYR77_09595 [Ignavibacteria bacterium]|nr:hypothetical protein [Ignavibacteria bacterium]